MSTEEQATPKPQAPSDSTIIRPIGKIRNPWTVVLLMIVTLGIYTFFYYYRTFEELKNYRGRGWSGTLYLLFQFVFPFPLLAIPWLVPAYIGRMYDEAGMDKPISGNTGWWVFVPIAGIFIWLFKVQNRLNGFWSAKGARS